MGIFGFFRRKRYGVGDTVRFGRYFFAGEKDLRPIEWIVLADEDGELILLSKYCLDVVHYFERFGEVAWEDSRLRHWLNGAFYDRAFTEKEKQRIVETVIVTDETRDPASHRNKLFILSRSQIEELLPDREKRLGRPTPYARQRGAGAGIDTRDEAVWWWVMPVSGDMFPGGRCPAIVHPNGQVLYHSRLVASPGSMHATVRPAIKIRK